MTPRPSVLREIDLIRYVEQLKRTGKKAAAAEAIGVTVATVSKYAAKDPVFAEECEHALQVFAETLEAEAELRATKGRIKAVVRDKGQVMVPEHDPETGEPVYRPAIDPATGQVMEQFNPATECMEPMIDPRTGEPRLIQHLVPYFERERSDRLLEKLLDGALPQKYARHLNVETKVSGTLGAVLVVPAMAVSAEDWERQVQATLQADALPPGAPAPLTIEAVPEDYSPAAETEEEDDEADPDIEAFCS